MKLFEIFNTDDKGTKHLNRDLKTFTPKKYPRITGDDKALGSGSFSYVKNNPTDPFVVKKTQAQQTKKDVKIEDSFSVYAQAISDKKLAQKNPHFPRIYKTKAFRGPNDVVRHQWEIEKLYPISSLSPEEVSMLDNRYFNQRGYTIDDDESLNSIFAWDRMDFLKDKTLIQAIEELKKIRDEHGLDFDVHSDNNMIRRTPHGPQLVFSDPFIKWLPDDQNQT